MHISATLRAVARRPPAPLLTALLAGPPAAWAIGWIPLGPDVGQQASAVAAAPGSPPAFYAATTAGIFGRVGDSPWQASLSGVPRDARANRLAVSPADPNRVVCLGSCGTPLVSEDGGRHWVARGDQFHPLRALLRPFEALALHPDDPDVLYIGGLGGIFRSTDGGESWRPVTDGLPAHAPVRDLTLAPDHPERLIAATLFGPWLSTDAAASWQRAGDGMPAWTTGLDDRPGDRPRRLRP